MFLCIHPPEIARSVSWICLGMLLNGQLRLLEFMIIMYLRVVVGVISRVVLLC